MLLCPPCARFCRSMDGWLCLLIFVTLAKDISGQPYPVYLQPECNVLHRGTCRLFGCLPDEFSVLPGPCIVYSAIFGHQYERCVNAMPCCYWSGVCQPSSCDSVQQVQLRGDQATCPNAGNVCCMPINGVQFPNAPTLTPIRPPTLSPTANPGSVALRQGECGRQGTRGKRAIPTEPRLLGEGVQVASSTDWPWMVRITFPALPLVFCAGVLIDDDTVVTSKQCASNFKLDSVQLTLGDYNAHAVDQDEVVMNVKSITGTKIMNGQVGLGLYKLQRPVRFNEHIRPACLPDPKIALLLNKCFVAGWGVSERELEDGSLRWSTVQVLPNGQCENLISNVGRSLVIPLASDEVCAIGSMKPTDGCVFDNGDMLVCQDANNRLALVGVMTNFNCNATSRLPMIFTDVRPHVESILGLL